MRAKAMAIYIDVKCFNHLSINIYFIGLRKAPLANNLQGSKSLLSLNLYFIEVLRTIHLKNIDKSLLKEIPQLLSIYRYIAFNLQNR